MNKFKKNKNTNISMKIKLSIVILLLLSSVIGVFSYGGSGSGVFMFNTATTKNVEGIQVQSIILYDVIEKITFDCEKNQINYYYDNIIIHKEYDCGIFNHLNIDTTYLEYIDIYVNETEIFFISNQEYNNSLEFVINGTLYQLMSGEKLSLVKESILEELEIIEQEENNFIEQDLVFEEYEDTIVIENKPNFVMRLWYWTLSLFR